MPTNLKLPSVITEIAYPLESGLTTSYTVRPVHEESEWLLIAVLKALDRQLEGREHFRERTVIKEQQTEMLTIFMDRFIRIITQDSSPSNHQFPILDRVNDTAGSDE